MLCPQGLQHATAKIGESNHASLQMFQQLGFQVQSTSQVFKEVTLSCQLEEGAVAQLLRAKESVMQCSHYSQQAIPREPL